MGYTKWFTNWQNGPAGGTPIDEAALDHIEAGIAAAATVADAAIASPASIASGEVPVWNGSAWVRSSVTKIGATSLGSGTPTSTKFLRGDSSWQTISSDGWNADSTTWTFGAADAPSYTVTATGDFTGTISAGMKFQLTHSASTKYFIVTKTAFAAGDTTLTLYGGTDYTLAAGAITAVSYSTHRAPYGFPLSPAKWTETTTSTSNDTQGTITAGTWYNVGARSLDIPIGIWRTEWYSVLYGDNDDTVALQVSCTLSTGDSTDIYVHFTTSAYLDS